MNLLDFIWDVEKPLELLPELVRKEFIGMAKQLKEQTKYEYNEICLIDAEISKHHNHKLHCCANKNPNWYAEIYYAHNSVDRKKILKALNEIIEGKDKKLSRYKQEKHFWIKLKKKRTIHIGETEIVFKKGERFREKRSIENYQNIYQTRFRELLYNILVKGYQFNYHYQPPNDLVRTYFGKYEPSEKKELRSLERLFEFYQPINETEQFAFEKEYLNMKEEDILKKLKFDELNYINFIWNFYNRNVAKEPKQEF
jgi:hypothetical protein